MRRVSALAAKLGWSWCLEESWAREQRGSVATEPRSRQDAEQLSHVEASSALQKINLPPERGAVSEVVEVEEGAREAERD